MRNLVEYPVQASEILSAYERMLAEFQKAHEREIGGIDTLCGFMLLKFLREPEIVSALHSSLRLSDLWNPEIS